MSASDVGQGLPEPRNPVVSARKRTEAIGIADDVLRILAPADQTGSIDAEVVDEQRPMDIVSLPRIDAWADALSHLVGEVEDANPENPMGSYPSALECALHVAEEVLRAERARVERRLSEPDQGIDA